jgi:small GTP-binding protein
MSKRRRKIPRPPSEPEVPPIAPTSGGGERPGTTFTDIGGSPVPGLKLLHVLRGHTKHVNRLAWSPDGVYIASPSADTTIRIWDTRSRKLVNSLADNDGSVFSVAWSLDGRRLASTGQDHTIRWWDCHTGRALDKLKVPDQRFSVSWSPDGRYLASGGMDHTVQVWDVENDKLLRSFEGHEDSVTNVAWSPDSRMLASGSSDKSIRVWEISERSHTHILEKHTASVYSVAWSPDGQRLASGSEDSTVCIWDPATGQAVNVLEASTGAVVCVAYSADGRWLASKDQRGVRLWRCDTWAQAAALHESPSDYWPPGIAFHPSLSLLATLGEKDTIIRIWELDEEALLSQAQESVQYTTAKLVLVGDSGVGKTGLGWRLAHGEFKEHASTHGQQFWAIPQLGLTRADGTQCEAVLWDLAGQHVYRQIHSIFLDNLSAALVVFDPSNRQEPLKGVQFWLEQLKGKGQLPPAVLVGGRVDRGAPALSQQDLDQFCQRYGVGGGYISTSASSGEGLDALLEALKAHIPWEQMTTTVTTVTFKRIKDHVLALKEKPDRTHVLVSPTVLREQLESSDAAWQFTDAEMMTAVGHLETHGYVAILRSSAGEQHILLAPELLVTLASSIVLMADKHPRELGAVSETDLLMGLPFAELKGLSPDESQTLLDAAILRLLQHNICFRATLDDKTLLIFPALIKQKRPLQDDLIAIDDISYVVRGRVENLYASLVVLLGYTPSFTRINQWQNQAQYEMDEGEICGFRLIEDREGEIEVVLYYGDRLPLRGRSQFQGLFEQFIYQREVEITRFPPVSCANNHRLERATVMARIREGKTFVFCGECGAKTELPNVDQPQSVGIGASSWLQREEAAARLRAAYEVQLTRVKSYRRTWATPRSYVSHLPEQAPQAEQLTGDLRDAGVFVVEQPPQVLDDDFVIVLDTAAYEKAFQSSSPALGADARLVKVRLGKSRLISLRLSGQSVAHTLKNCRPGDFHDRTHYPMALFDLVLNLYAIPFAHVGFAPARETLHDLWERTLSRFAGASDSPGLRIFVSYAHVDEPFKDELVTMLAGLQRSGVIDAWHDRRIEPGQDWLAAIKGSIADCDVALLLISPNFIASPFVNDEELPDLLERRKAEGMVVLPIIVRDCLWQSEPILKDLQALPKDGKPIISFQAATGERDQVWKQVSQAIEKLAKSKVKS